MKVLHINKFGPIGGAGIAAARLHRSLIRCGVNSEFLCSRFTGGLEFCHSLYSTPTALLVDRFKNALWSMAAKYYREEHAYDCSLNFYSNSLLNKIKEISPDVVHLHWIGGNMLKVEDLPRITCPVVWTLHDMWAFCGCEHYNTAEPNTSARWVNGYSSEFKGASRVDLSRLVYRRKERSWAQLNIHLNGPSRWMVDSARRSKLFIDNQNVTFSKIPNCVDENVFRPKDQKKCRRSLGLPQEKTLLLFSAHSLDNPIKGRRLLHRALEGLAAAQGADLALVVLGGGSAPSVQGIDIHHLGTLRGDEVLSSVYNAVDISLHPSLCDNLPNTVVESILCGTPVVAFDVGGISDIIKDGISGYLATAGSVSSFLESINACLVRIKCDESLSKSAAEFGAANFSYTSVVEQYIDLYRKLIINRK